jgi:3'-phosphoadenosine 5'-phosphosulfate sulfotransferase (PAPS reductase)/FAD synthetase
VIGAALRVIDDAVREYDPSHVFALFSGGHDSLTATAITAKHPAFTAAVHINTGIGIEETREFVRVTCSREGWPLIELHPDAKIYEDLIREHGFGHGPKAHSRYYYWLKQRQMRRLVREHKRHRNDRIVLTTGIRRAESTRRSLSGIAQHIDRRGASVYVNPILEWTGADCSDFIEAEGLARNPVVDRLHRSGECLCGAMFAKGERQEVFFWQPEIRERIERLEAECGPGWGVTKPAIHREQMAFLPLCQSCEARVA